MRLSNLKAWFGFLYFWFCLVLLGAAVTILVQGGFDWAWLGAAVASLPLPALFLAVKLVRNPATAHAGSRWLAVLGSGGLMLAAFGVTFAGSPATSALLALVAMIGFLLFEYWYSRLGRPANPTVAVGQRLQEFGGKDLEGRPVSSKSLIGQPALLMFFRGNWCPFCTAQVRELAERYREIVAHGVRIVFISPQPADLTRRVAGTLGVAADFWVDTGAGAARALGLLHESGVPVGLRRRFGVDTVLPTVLLIDADGVILYSDQTDNYRERPRPEQFLRVMAAHGL